MKTWIQKLFSWFLKPVPEVLPPPVVEEVPKPEPTIHDKIHESINLLKGKDFYKLFSLYIELSITPCINDVQSFRLLLTSLVWHLTNKVEIDRAILKNACVVSIRPSAFLIDTSGMLVADAQYEMEQFLDEVFLFNETIRRLLNEKVSDAVTDHNVILARPVLNNLNSLLVQLISILSD